MPPRHLRADDDLSRFDCGVPELNDWLRKRAMMNHVSGASRTYVWQPVDRVEAFYCLSSGSVDHDIAPGPVRRNMPSPIPAIVLGRLAVDLSVRGKGVGAHLLDHAMGRCR